MQEEPEILLVTVRSNELRCTYIDINKVNMYANFNAQPIWGFQLTGLHHSAVFGDEVQDIVWRKDEAPMQLSEHYVFSQKRVAQTSQATSGMHEAEAGRRYVRPHAHIMTNHAWQ